MSEDFTQYHLTATGCSKKGVRCRVLSGADIDAVLEAAAKLLARLAASALLGRTEMRMGAEAMVVQVSKAPADTVEALTTGGWEAFDPQAKRPQLNAKD